MSSMPAITDFPLAWRWTSSSHAMFLPTELAALHPCSPDEAARIHDASIRALRGDSLDPQQFERIYTLSADIPVADACSWLRALSSDLTESVTLSWQRDTALRTTWELFTERWDDFCYPSSDDIVVLPDCGRWVLLYHHWEEFHFAARAN